MFGFTKNEFHILKKLNTPEKIQDYINAIPMNFEKGGDTCLSPRRVLREKRAHCIEGALLAAVALRLRGDAPLLLDLTAYDYDDDHVVALFRQYGRWGAISKTNHAMLRYRDPVFKTISELALSYFNEYFSLDGRKSLKSYSMRPLHLAQFDSRGWMTSEKNLWYICTALNKLPHENILPRSLKPKNLRSLDPVELKAGTIIQWRKKRKSRR